MDSMKQKIIDLRSQMDEIKDEIDGNEELGQKVTKVVEQKASEAEFSKYQRFTGELNKIIGLLLILTQRMHRYEMMLNDLDMSEEADRQQRVSEHISCGCLRIILMQSILSLKGDEIALNNLVHYLPEISDTYNENKRFRLKETSVNMIVLR